jgi:proline racemase
VAEPRCSLFDVGQLLQRFRDDAALVARMLVESEGFRSMCEDLVLARSTLVELESFQREREPTKIAEYRQLVADLEGEVAGAIKNAKRQK